MTQRKDEKIKITGRGVALGCSGMLMLLVGLLIQDGSMITLGLCALLLLSACRVLARRNMDELELSVQLPARFFAARHVPAVVELHNGRRLLNARAVEITIRFPHKVMRKAEAVWTAAGDSSAWRERVNIPDRAQCSQVDCELRSRFPLGCFEVRKESSADCPIVVYPQLITPTELRMDGRDSNLNPVSGIGFGDEFGEPRGIRPYQPGDKAARIHQFASAHAISRGHGLQVRAFDPPGFHPSRCRIIFHSLVAAREVVRPDRFERALSLLAGTLAHFQTSQTQVTLHADFEGWRSRPCRSRCQYFACLSFLVNARRQTKTREEELVEVLQRVPEDEQLIVISDSMPEGWVGLIPSSHQDAIPIDIRQVRYKRRSIRSQLSECS